MKSRGMTSLPVRMAAFAVAAGCAGAQAADVGYHVSVGAGQSDNITRSRNDKQSETMAIAGFDFSILQRTSRLNVDATADVSWYDYLENTYDSEIIGSLNGQARYEIVPQRLAWVVQDNFGQETLEPFLPVTPDNRENVNYLTTGPDVSFGLASNTRLRLSGRYSDVSYEDSPLDNQRVLGRISLVRTMSEVSTLSLNAQRETIRFEEGPDSLDYDLDQAFLRYDASGHRTALGVDLGYSRLDLESGKNSGVVAQIDVSRMLSSSSTLIVTAGRQFSDAGDSFRSEQDLPSTGSGARPSSRTPDPFTRKYATVGWQFKRNRTNLSFNVAQVNDHYETASALNDKRLAVTADLGRRLTPTLMVSLRGSYSRQDFDAGVADYNETSAVASVIKGLGRNLSLTVEYTRLQRDSDLRAGEFGENRIWLQLSYGRLAPDRGLAIRPPRQ